MAMQSTVGDGMSEVALLPTHALAWFCVQVSNSGLAWLHNRGIKLQKLLYR